MESVPACRPPSPKRVLNLVLIIHRTGRVVAKKKSIIPFRLSRLSESLLSAHLVHSSHLNLRLASELSSAVAPPSLKSPWQSISSLKCQKSHMGRWGPPGFALVDCPGITLHAVRVSDGVHLRKRQHRPSLWELTGAPESDPSLHHPTIPTRDAVHIRLPPY